VKIAEIRPRLWRWTALHPDWTPESGGPTGWDQEVASFALVHDDSLVLFDPLVPSDEEERFWRHLDADVEHHGPPQILLTVYWHARSAPAILDRYEGTRIWTVEAGAASARERVAVTDTFSWGDALPGGVEARATGEQEETVFWIPSHGALVCGDSLLGTPTGGVRVPDSWLSEGVTPEMAREGLRPLLSLPVELVLVTHGEPVLEDGKTALEEALEPLTQ
jgi:glyoxylase-like metal-dependent hydrolase (beta-lactamase superfamily II)